jgi:hypothetical protein
MDELNRQLRRQLRQFLAAAESDDGERADSALSGVFAALPPVDPRAGFSERVMTRALGVGRSRSAAMLPDFGLFGRILTFCALLLAALAALNTAPLLAGLLAGDGGSIAARAAGALGALARQADILLVLSRLAEQVGDALLAAFASPAGALALLGFALSTTLLGRWVWTLVGLKARRRGPEEAP